MYVPLCEPWPLPPSGCPSPTGSPEVTGAAVLAASEILWELTGYQYGACSVLLRPCRQDCAGVGFPGRWWDGTSWPHGTPAPGSSLWWQAACGVCMDACSCNNADTLRLPLLVQSVTEVLVDGAPVTGVALYDGNLLVRTDGLRWPLCQDWTVPVSGVGAWSIEVVAGRPVPMAGKIAMGQLATEYARWCTSGECRMPAYTSQKTRQGVTQTFPTAAELAQLGLTGLAWVDRFVTAENPAGLRGSPAIWNPDDFTSGPRRPGGVTG